MRKDRVCSNAVIVLTGQESGKEKKKKKQYRDEYTCPVAFWTSI